jgi:hypothetical protein
MMHDSWHWGFGHGGLGILFWIGVIIVVVSVIRAPK